jgi:hypothetical protein
MQEGAIGALQILNRPKRGRLRRTIGPVPTTIEPVARRAPGGQSGLVSQMYCDVNDTEHNRAYEQ